jgi:hypothetical protein
MRASRSPFWTWHDAAELGDRDAGLRRQFLDLGAQSRRLSPFGLGEFRQPRADRPIDFDPVRIKLGAVILRQEVVARHTVAFGQAQQAALVLHEALVDRRAARRGLDAFWLSDSDFTSVISSSFSCL